MCGDILLFHTQSLSLTRSSSFLIHCTLCCDIPMYAVQCSAVRCNSNAVTSILQLDHLTTVVPKFLRSHHCLDIESSCLLFKNIKKKFLNRIKSNQIKSNQLKSVFTNRLQILRYEAVANGFKSNRILDSGALRSESRIEIEELL